MEEDNDMQTVHEQSKRNHITDNSKADATMADVRNGTPSVTITFSLKDARGALTQLLKPFEGLGINMTHIESRPSHANPGAEYDFYIDCDGSPEDIVRLVGQLNTSTQNLMVYSNQSKQGHSMWIPRRIKDLDRFANDIACYGADLDPDHPGFSDPVYCERRKFFSNIAFNYRHGQPIPRVEYTEEEVRTWGIIFREQTKRYPTHACKEYNYLFPLLAKNCGYREDNIPQLQDVSDYLKECTGFQLRPVAGLLSSRQFLAGLAFRVFHSTQYIRHASRPSYTPEPDICHELLGHAPLFCDPDFAQFSQTLGLASLGAPDEYIEKLSTLYWFTLEFGMCKQNGAMKAYGAGLLSSIKELQYCQTDEPKFQPFDPDLAAVQTYPMNGMQPLYFLAESFQDATDKLIKWTKQIPQPHAIRYDPYAQSIVVLDNKHSIKGLAADIQYSIGKLEEAVNNV